MRPSLWAAVVLISSLPCGCVFAEGKSEEHMEKSGEDLRRVSYTSALDDSKRDFFLYIPRGYESDRTRSWPVILFLHGDGERGDGRGDLDFLLKNGPLYEAWIQKRDLPFLIIAPQLPMFGRNLPGGPPYLVNRSRAEIPARQTNGVPKHTEDTPAPGQMEGATAIDASVLGYSLPNGWERVESDVIEVLDTVLSDYRADRKRVYLTGLSYGGFGTWYLAGRHPERFAAISPISGWGRPELIAPIAKVKLPVWAFSGGKDQIVETRYFFMGLNLLRELGDPDVRFTTHQDMGHDVWNRIYAGADLYDWFLSKSR